MRILNEVDRALQRMARGTGVVFVGIVISMALGFLARALIAREFSKAEYGTFNLALTVLNIGLVIATFGLQNALPREVAFYREREPGKVDRLISAAIAITAVSAAITALLIFFLAGDISLIFREERLVSALRIIVLALPFSALTAVLISASRGFGRVREQVYFQNITYPLIWLALVASITALRLPFNSMFYAYSLAQLITFFALFLETCRIGLLRVGSRFDIELGKRLMAFSIPLMLVGVLNFMMTWTDILMLG